MANSNTGSDTNTNTQDRYEVVVNDEAQYSIWRADRPIPPGWRSAGKTGPRADCLAYIEETWTDMRPMSMRRTRDSI